MGAASAAAAASSGGNIHHPGGPGGIMNNNLGFSGWAQQIQQQNSPQLPGSNVGANAAIAQGDPNNVLAEGFGTNTGATGVGAVGSNPNEVPTVNMPIANNAGVAMNQPVQGQFSTATNNIANNMYGSLDARNRSMVSPNTNLRLKGLI